MECPCSSTTWLAYWCRGLRSLAASVGWVKITALGGQTYMLLSCNFRTSDAKPVSFRRS